MRESDENGVSTLKYEISVTKVHNTYDRVATDEVNHTSCIQLAMCSMIWWSERERGTYVDI